MRVSRVNLNSSCGLCVDCRSVRPISMHPLRMVNLLGDLWQNGEPDWQALWRFHVLSYTCTANRKHVSAEKWDITATADTTTHAKTIALRARHALTVASY